MANAQEKINEFFKILGDNNINADVTVLNGNIKLGKDGAGINLVPTETNTDELEDTDKVTILLEDDTDNSIRKKSRKLKHCDDGDE